MGNFVIFYWISPANLTLRIYIISCTVRTSMQFLSIFVTINVKNYKKDFIHDSDFIFLVDLRQVCNKYTTNKEYFRK